MTAEQRSAYYEKQRNIHREANKRYRAKSPEKCKASEKNWRIKNPEKMRENRNRHYYRTKETGGATLLRKAISVRINNALKRYCGVGKKGASWPKVLGYSAQDLARHLERQFHNGMTWQNWGSVWSLDHIIPVSSFKIKEVGDPEFLACWALTNLRPLCAEENRRKSDKRLYLL